MLEERTVRGLHDSLEREIASVPRSARVIDLGCGTGAWLARLKRLGFQDVEGADLQPPVGQIQADLNEVLKLDRKFSLVTAIEVIEHLHNPGNLLRSVSDMLAPEGLFLLTTPNIHSLRARIKFVLTGRLPSFDERGDPTHVIPLSLVAFTRLASRHGLEIERTWTYPAEGSHIFGRPISFAANLARLVIHDPLPGDTLCLQLRRTRPSEVPTTAAQT